MPEVSNPKPKCETVVFIQQGIPPFFSDKIWLEIYVSSNDAWNWINQEYERFARRFFPPDNNLPAIYLSVLPIYDIGEVAKFLAQEGLVVNKSNLEIPT